MYARFLKHLDFSNNYIGRLGAITLAENIEQLTDLRTLNLLSNGIEPEGVIELAKQFKLLQKITTVNLENNHVEDVAVKLQVIDMAKQCQAPISMNYSCLFGESDEMIEQLKSANYSEIEFDANLQVK